MGIIGILFFIVVAVALLSVRREYAPIPLLVGCCYMTIGQGLEIGPISMPIYRMLLLVGFIRAAARGERLVGELNGVDKLVISLMAWLLFASIFHEQRPGSGLVYMLGRVFNIALVYFLVRTWCGSVADIVNVIAAVALVLAPVALAMVYEQVGGKNLFAFLGGIPEAVVERDGRLRAQGPFRHPILAGTVGAASFPMMIGIWNTNRRAAMIGAAACLAMVVTSSSSGPLASLIAGSGMLAAWKLRHLARHAVWVGVLGYVFIEVVSTRPAYHVVVTRLDFTGSSTAYYRARLIDTTIAHFSEWWAIGTDYTRHWIPEGIGSVVADGRHMDITNYYIGFGVGAGLLAVILVLAIVAKCLVGLVRQINEDRGDGDTSEQFMIWCVGASLFTHATSALSIAYFDQSQTFFWLSIAAVSSLLSVRDVSAESAPEEEESLGELRIPTPRRFG